VQNEVSRDFTAKDLAARALSPRESPSGRWGYLSRSQKKDGA
jgi:hypothetical protein